MSDNSSSLIPIIGTVMILIVSVILRVVVTIWRWHQ